MLRKPDNKTRTIHVSSQVVCEKVQNQSDYLHLTNVFTASVISLLTLPEPLE